MQITDLSSTGRWNTLVRENQYNIDELYLYNVPAILLEKIALKSQEHWENFAVPAQNYCTALSTGLIQKNAITVTDAKQFIEFISDEKSPYTVAMLIDVLKEVTHLKKLLLKGAKKLTKEEQNEITLQRFNADNCYEMGSLSEINKKTLKDLADQIEKIEGWKQLADGLGFGNDSYRKIQNPLQMLKSWMNHHYRANKKSATIARLCFEAQQAKMEAVCNYLKAISMEGKSKNITYILPRTLLECQMTRYHLVRFEQICRDFGCQINWELLIDNYCNDAVKKELELNEISPVDLIWQSRSSNVTDFLSLFKRIAGTHLAAHELEKEIKQGTFQLKSSAGIKYSDIYFLGITKYSIDIKEIPACSDFERMCNSLKESFEEIFNTKKYIITPDPNPFGTLAEKHFKRSKSLFPEMQFHQFIEIFWQYHDELNIFDFCYKLISVLEEIKEIKESDLIPNLKKQMNKILPYRSYSPELHSANVKKQKEKDFLREQAIMISNSSTNKS